MDFLEKVKNAGIIGMGGAGFPAYKKLELAKSTKSEYHYLICNSSEGELGLFKDLHILENHLEDLFKGIKYVLDYLGSDLGFLYINRNYYTKLKEKLEDIVFKYSEDGYSITPFIEEPSYIGGDASTILNMMEFGKNQPMFKKDRTAVKGLFGQPTVIHNVETLYNICLVIEDRYDNKRFSGIFGDGVDEKFVIRHDFDASIKDILDEAKIKLNDKYFVQIGGSASGTFLNYDQLADNKMIQAGSIEIYNKKERGPLEVLKRLFDFYEKESCGKCTPCRCGSKRLKLIMDEVTKEKNIPWDEIVQITNLMGLASFCGLGQGIRTPVKTYMENILGKSYGR